MQYKVLGKTGLKVSAIGFGCGSVGGLLVRGDYPMMRHVVNRAVELGVNYFDTASQYGNGQSEVNLGAVLRELRPDVLVGTKVRLAPGDLADIENAVVRAVEGSLRRLGRESVDLIQFHNRIGYERDPARDQVAIDDLGVVTQTFQALERQGKIRFWGITGLGPTHALHQVVTGGGFHTVQVPYNLLNPSAGVQVSPDFPFQDYQRLIDQAAANQIGVIVIRMLAAGALSGTTERHAVAAPSVAPISSDPTYAEDVEKARYFAFLIKQGFVTNLVEGAIRFVIGKPEVSTALVGISSLEQLEQAVAYANRGPLPAAALEHITVVQSTLSAHA